MSTERTLDGYLRPSFEWRTIVYSVVAVLFLWMFAPWIGLSDKWLIVFSMIFLVLVGNRLNSLIYIKKYQMSLNVIDAFHLKADEIPWTDKLQWIGKGFAYLDSDAQKVWDAKKENLKPFYELPSFVEKLRANEISVELRRGVNKGLKERIGAFIATISKRQEFTIAILNISIRNIYKPLPPVGGNPLYHATGFVRETDIFMPLDDRAGHTIMFGQSRVGKTVFLRSQISQDIARRNGVAGVFDPKGDLELLGIMWSEAKRLNREEDFYVFLLGEPEISARYNAISSFSRLTAIAGRIANQMSGGGDGQVFKDFAFNFMVYVSAALLEMGEQPDFKSMKANIENLEGLFNRYGKHLMRRDNPNYKEEYEDLNKPKFKMNAKGDMVEERLKIGAMKGRDYATVITDKITSDFYERNPRLVNQYFEGLRATMKSDSQYTSKLTASLIPLLTKLTSGQLADIISPNFNDMKDTRPTFSWDKIIQRKGIFYAGFSSMQDELVAEAVGNQFFADLVAKAGEINNYGINKGIPGASTKDITPIWLHCDEFQSLMGDEFIPLLNRSGSAGVRVTAYTQTRADIEAKLGDKAKADVVLGNFNNVFMMRVANQYTAEYLTEMVRTADVLGLDVGGATSDGGAITPKSTFSNDNEDGKSPGEGFFGTRTQAAIKVEAHQPIISPETIMTLPKGQAFAYINRNKLVKLRFPILHDASGGSAGEMEEIRKELKEKIRAVA
ncbi:conjugative transfer system coupling protein TraD [Vibrio sp. 1180_3]|uniref:conjugative transfer system coupling protein TraD n=1 Tax=Vibrio sp. 1180_3 TaxID=2528832 RepID=UPI002406FC18|nr:conjugative transfer system coupling protein TraD [Vibrio sp. 1180_3]MDF9399102.1 hypothetical protein [Vibrio sp. 1180_3]